MRKSFVTRALPYLVVALSLGCEDSGGTVRPLSDVPARTVEDGLFFLEPQDDGSSDALTLDVSTDDAHVVRHDLPEGTAQTLVRPGREGREVIVFTSGRDAYVDADKKRHALVPAHLLVFGRTGQLMRHELSGVFAKLELSEDGKYALAYQSSGLLVLQNAIEAIDLDKVAAGDPAASELVELSLDGRETSRLVFSPKGSFRRRLAIAPQTNALQIIDLENPKKREISITLSNVGSLVPGKIVFTENAFFVQCVNSPQILSFEYIALQRGEHDFQLAPTVLTASGNVTDLAVVGSGDKLRLLALSSKLDVIDPAIGTTASVEVGGMFSQILQFDGASPVDGNVVARAALFAPGRAQVGFIDLGNESAWATRNVELIELAQPVQSVQYVPGKKLALVRHAASSLSVVDLQKRTVKPLLLDATSAATLLDESAAHARLWVATGNGSLGSVNLDSFVATPVPLSFEFKSDVGADKPVGAEGTGSLLLVPRAGGARRLAVLQQASSGRVTFLDTENPTPASALEVLGFFLAGLFD